MSTDDAPAEGEAKTEEDGATDEAVSRGPGFDAIAAAAELEAAMLAADEGEGAGDSSAYVEILESEIEALNEQLAQKDTDLSEAQARADEARAEVDSSRERLRRDAQRETEKRARSLLVAFVEVLDDLDRALESAKSTDHNPEVVAGIELVRKRFLATFERFGVRPSPAAGERFDPTLHDAVSTIPVDDASEDGVVLSVVSDGYSIGDEVLRPAVVVVGRAS